MKRKRGRPKGRDPNKLYRARAFRLSEAESQEFDRKAAEQGISAAVAFRKLVSSFIRGSFAIQTMMF